MTVIIITKYAAATTLAPPSPYFGKEVSDICFYYFEKLTNAKSKAILAVMAPKKSFLLSKICFFSALTLVCYPYPYVAAKILYLSNVLLFLFRLF